VADLTYTARNPLPVFLTRGRDNAIEVRVYNDTSGAEVAPASGTISVFNASGVAVVDEVAVTVASNFAEYTVLAAVVPVTESFSEWWNIQWTLSLDSVLHKFNQRAHLVRWNLSNPVSTADISGRHLEIADVLTTAQIQGHSTRAWEWLLRRLLDQGRMPWRILDSNQLFDVTLSRALHYAFIDQHASVGGSGKYGELADYYDGKAASALGTVTVTYDDDDDGKPDAGEDGTAAIGAIFMGGPGNWFL